MTDRKITIADFLTDAQIRKAMKYDHARDILEHVIQPNWDEINTKLGGGDNVPMYWAYAVEYALSKAKGA